MDDREELVDRIRTFTDSRLGSVVMGVGGLVLAGSLLYVLAGAL